MNAVLARSPLQHLPMAANRTTTRRRSAKQAFEDDDAPVAKRLRTETNGAGKRMTGATKKAAKTSYDENDDGFQFTRRTSRRTTAKAQSASEPIPQEPLKPAPARRKNPSLAPLELEQGEPQRRRRSARLSGDKEQLEVHPEPAKPPAKRTKKTAPSEKKKQVTPAPEPEKGAFSGVKTPQHDGLHVAKKRNGGAAKIMLPFADTPVITRNKEMRKGNRDGHRRSSTGLRGRRASSLIESGLSNALPHSEVEVSDFYKYIEQSLPEPRRMKQLLTWCASRALLEKPSGDVKDTNAIMAARAIQQELIEDFANKPELSDWFSREDDASQAVVKQPNPVNIKNQATLQELEEEVKRLEEEKAIWEAIASSSNLMPPPPPPSISIQAPTLSDIDASLLDPSQAAILASLHQLPPSTESAQGAPSSTSKPPFSYTTPSALQSHLETLSLSLEPSIDLLADGVHKIQQYRNTAERVADRVLGTAAIRLEERDKRAKVESGSEAIGTGDLLRGLAGVLSEE
ncbi:kinetochore protein Mis13 [Lojkania enalia]|uniref:Kinetochore protein Mis13 n=1 Tax=Lojkania enalia TaxID=147567 RepID=A0A9P4MWG9_9PLEO|nr:kinetochore protein Mis13 [Didymosphaeria enalia]